MVTAQKLAAEAVRRVLAGRSLSPTLEELLARNPSLSAGERGAVWDLSHGTLRFLGTIDALIALMVRKPITEAGLHCLLRVGVFQLEFTRAAPYAVVSQAVDACVDSGWPWAKGMVNAVLRRYQREREALLDAARGESRGRFSYPDWWSNRLRRQYGARADEILEAGNQRPAMALRVNRRRATPAQVLERLAALGLGARHEGGDCIILERIVAIASLPGFADGCVSVQDAGAQRAAGLLDLKPGQRVLDACAAPGGKTGHILETEAVEVVALDNDPVRLARVGENLDRLGLRAQLRCADARAIDAWWDGRVFERILADVPCSASGVVRRHPDIKWLRRDTDLGQLAAQASTLLDALWRVLAPGGKLLFVTCSVFQEENRAQIDDFLGRHADARLVPLPGIATEDLQLLPDATHDGFYYALLEQAHSCPASALHDDGAGRSD